MACQESRSSISDKRIPREQISRGRTLNLWSHRSAEGLPGQTPSQEDGAFPSWRSRPAQRVLDFGANEDLITEVS